jgi:hypothetical protein
LRPTGADSIDDCGLLPDEEVPRSMKHQAALLLGCLDRHETHTWPLYRLTDGLGVGSIILLAFDVGLHISRRDEAHGMTESPKLARPMM